MESTNSNQSESNSPTRREVLQVAGVGISGIAGVGSATARINQTEKVKRVPKYYNKGEAIEWMEVPYNWYEHKEHAKRALHTFNSDEFYIRDDIDITAPNTRNILPRRKEILETGLVRSDRTFNDWNGFQIEVIVNKEEHRPSIPESLSGIPVKSKAKDPSWSRKQACKNSGDFASYRGGLNIFDGAPSNSDRGAATAGYPVSNDSGSTYYMVSASHNFDDCGVNIGDTTYQESSILGSIVDGDIKADYVVTDTLSSVNLTDKIQEPDGTIRDIAGSASEDEVDRRVSEYFDSYEKIGVSTGKETGGLNKKNINKNDCQDLRFEGIRGSARGAGGDSGGPWYDKKDGDAYILGHHVRGDGTYVGSVNCDGSHTVTSETIAMPSFWIENNTPYSVWA